MKCVIAYVHVCWCTWRGMVGWGWVGRRVGRQCQAVVRIRFRAERSVEWRVRKVTPAACLEAGSVSGMAREVPASTVRVVVHFIRLRGGGEGAAGAAGSPPSSSGWSHGARSTEPEA